MKVMLKTTCLKVGCQKAHSDSVWPSFCRSDLRSAYEKARADGVRIRFAMYNPAPPESIFNLSFTYDTEILFL